MLSIFGVAVAATSSGTASPQEAVEGVRNARGGLVLPELPIEASCACYLSASFIVQMPLSEQLCPLDIHPLPVLNPKDVERSSATWQVRGSPGEFQLDQDHCEIARGNAA